MGVLQEIITSKQGELAELRTRKLPAPPSTLPVLQLKREGADALRLICEIKQKSPSAGVLSTHLSISQRASVYEKHGASMLSVLCDGPFFDGSYEHLLRAREGCSLPLLCKEFVIDECQLDAASAFGASAVLLIVRCLSEHQLAVLIRAAVERGLLPLVEVYTQTEASLAVDCGATFVGVNARDLDTLQMDAATANKIVQSFGPTITVAHLSGIQSPAAIRTVAAGRADAALVGEVLMRQDDPSLALIELIAAC